MGVTPQDVQLVVIGFISGLEDKNLKADVQTCVNGSSDLMNDISNIIDNLEAQTEEGLKKALEELEQAVGDIQTALSDCKG